MKKIASIILYVVLGVVALVGLILFQMRGILFDYSKSSRDIARIKKINITALNIFVEHEDTGGYLSSPLGCIPSEIIQKYPETSKDPEEFFIHDGCGLSLPGFFAYRLIENENSEKIVILSANMENPKNGNSSYSIEEIEQNPKLLNEISPRGKGGKYYIWHQ